MRFIIALICTLFVTAIIAETRIVTGKSEENLSLNATFNGKEILVYGAIETDLDVPLAVVVIVRGPDQTVKVNKKDRMMGLWLNSESIEFPTTPSYLAILSNWSPNAKISDELRSEFKLGLETQIDSSELSGNITHADDFVKALVRIRERQGQFYKNDHGVRMQGGILFSADVPLPANLIEGNYTFDIFAVQNGEVTAHTASKIPVRQTGVGRWLYNLSNESGLLYGLLAVFLSVAISIIATQAVRLFGR